MFGDEAKLCDLKCAWGDGRRDFGNLTKSVRHAVEEDPGAGVRAVLDKADVVAGLDAEHSEQLHGVPR